MKFRQLKHSIFLLFGGIMIGIFIGFYTDRSPQEAFLSPVSLTLAETRKFLTPSSEGEILGTATTPAKTKKKESKQHNSQFASLINQSAEEKVDKVKKVDKVEKKDDFNQSNYSESMMIAAVGDSMTDLMGPNLPYLRTELQKYYPQAQFNLLNYGVGAENIEKGLARIGGEYTYQGRHYPALATVDPDIVIIESFAYNPFSDGDNELDRHWSALTKMVDFVKSNTRAQIIILATIAPAKAEFGQGPAGVNWPQDLAWQHGDRIGRYLDNAVRFAQSAGLPLVDVYHQTLLANGEGNPAYINPGDHIHQNVAGNELVSQMLAKKIYELGLFK